MQVSEVWHGKTEALLISPHSTHVSACCCSLHPRSVLFISAALCVRARERKREILREPNLLYASALQHFPDATAHVDKNTVDHIYKTQKHTHTQVKTY